MKLKHLQIFTLYGRIKRATRCIVIWVPSGDESNVGIRRL